MFIIFVWLDEDLEKLKSNDPNTLEKLYKEYKDKVFNFLIIKTSNNREIVQEVFSETFHSVLLNINKLKNIDNLQGWIIQIASRRLNDFFRKKYREKKYLNKIQNKDKDIKDPVFESIEKRQEVLMLDMAMEALSEDYKTVVKLKYIEKKSLQEISEELNKTIPSINNLLLRARKALKKEFKKITEGFAE